LGKIGGNRRNWKLQGVRKGCMEGIREGMGMKEGRKGRKERKERGGKGGRKEGKSLEFIKRGELRKECVSIRLSVRLPDCPSVCQSEDCWIDERENIKATKTERDRELERQGVREGERERERDGRASLSFR
jgi:hypothetical protein